MLKTPPPLLGFNNNVKHRGRIFHIQTEDSGVKRPHVITHLFADGGRIVRSQKTVYSEHVGRPDISQVVRLLMREQHKAMFIALRAGEFDELIEGICGPHPLPPPEPKPVAGSEGSAPSSTASQVGEASAGPASASPSSKLEGGIAASAGSAPEVGGAQAELAPRSTASAQANPWGEVEDEPKSGAIRPGAWPNAVAEPASSGSGPVGDFSGMPPRRLSNPNLHRIDPEQARALVREVSSKELDIDVDSHLSQPPPAVREVTTRASADLGVGAPHVAAASNASGAKEADGGRYAAPRPATIFEPQPERASIFGGGISEQTLDDVILSYIAEDLDE